MLAISALQRHFFPTVSSTFPPFATYVVTGSAEQRKSMVPDGVL